MKNLHVQNGARCSNQEYSLELVFSLLLDFISIRRRGSIITPNFTMIAFVKILGILAILLTAGNGKPNRVPWWQIKVAKSQGPNACVVEEVPELNKKYWTECKFWPVRKVCGKETLIRYECCEGYQQIQGEEGCTGVKPLRNVIDTARELGATKFVKYLEDSGISRELIQEGTYTLFAPFDTAFEGAAGHIASMKIESFLTNPDNPVLRYHISEQKYPSSTFSGNTEIESQYQRLKLRISKYSSGMEAVNCILISRKDQEASNGIVHMIDHPLDPTLFMPRDVAQIVVEDGRFARMADAMNRCDFMSRFREAHQTFTVLAPSDEAFLKIPPSHLDRILNDRQACTALLENHVIPHVMCMPVITEEFKARTIGPLRVAFDCDERGNTVEGNKIMSDYTLGFDGIVYMLDDVLIPDRARTILELAQLQHLATFLQLVQVAGLEETLNTLRDYTIFIPSEEAFYSMDSELLNEAKQNPTLAQKLLLFHATRSRILSKTIKNNQMSMSLDEENPLRLLVYRKAYGVEDAIIEKSDIEGMNGVIHIINKVIFPGSESAGDILRKSGNFTLFLQSMESVLASDSDAIDLRKRVLNSNHYTFFAPTDQAFRNLDPYTRRRMLSDEAYMTKVIKNHVSSSMMSASSFRPNLTYTLPTRQKTVGVSCDKFKRMKVNGASVVQQDIVSTNGIIHVVDQILVPESD